MRNTTRPTEIQLREELLAIDGAGGRTSPRTSGTGSAGSPRDRDRAAPRRRLRRRRTWSGTRGGCRPRATPGDRVASGAGRRGRARWSTKKLSPSQSKPTGTTNGAPSLRRLASITTSLLGEERVELVGRHRERAVLPAVVHSRDRAVDLEREHALVVDAELAQDLVGVLGELRRPAQRGRASRRTAPGSRRAPASRRRRR